MSRLLELAKDLSKKADERVCFSVSSKMTHKSMSFDLAFEKTIRTLRKGIDEDRKENLRLMALDVCKEDCKNWGVEFKL